MSAPDSVQPYVTAFLDAAFERWFTTLSAVETGLSANPGLSGRLQDPTVDFRDRQRALDAILPADVDAPVRNLLYTMMQRGDLAYVDELAAVLRQRLSTVEAGPTEVEVVSAISLTEEQQHALERALNAEYEVALEFEYRVDPAIMGGMIVRIGDQLIDGSVATRLAAMKHSLGVSTAE